MICPQCGADVVHAALFCHKCGLPLDPPKSSPSADPQPPDLLPQPAAETAPQDALQPDAESRRDEPEQELWQGSYSPRSMTGAWLLASATTLAGLVLAMLLGGMWWWIVVAVVAIFWIVLAVRLAYLRLSVAYHLTSQRFVHQLGLLRRVTDRIEVIDMDDVTLVQGPIERLLGTGTIKVTSSDRTHPEFWLRGIDNAADVAAMIDTARRAERVRRGLHIESI